MTKKSSFHEDLENLMSEHFADPVQFALFVLLSHYDISCHLRFIPLIYMRSVHKVSSDVL